MDVIIIGSSDTVSNLVVNNESIDERKSTKGVDTVEGFFLVFIGTTGTFVTIFPNKCVERFSIKFLIVSTP